MMEELTSFIDFIKEPTEVPEDALSDHTGKDAKKRVKSFKLNEQQFQRVEEILESVNGTTEANKLVESLEHYYKQMSLPELPLNLKRMYEGDRERLTTAIHTIQHTFEAIVLGTSEMLDQRLKEQDDLFQVQLDDWIKKENTLEAEIGRLELGIESAQRQLEETQAQNEAWLTEITNHQALMTAKDQHIAELSSQLEDLKNEKRQLNEHQQQQLTQLQSDLTQALADERHAYAKMERLEEKIETLQGTLLQSQQDNQELKSKLIIGQQQYQQEYQKGHDLTQQIAHLQQQLARENQLLNEERANNAQLQQQLIELMKHFKTTDKQKDQSEG